MNLQYMFVSFFVEERLNQDLNLIETCCLEQKKLYPSTERRSNRGGWQSENVTHLKELNSLKNDIEGIAEKIADKFNFNSRLTVDNMWINVNGKNSYNSPHIHEGFLSGVFYVKAPVNSGNIIISHPNIHHDVYIPKTKDWNEYTATNLTYFAEENKLLIFPSYLSHYVQPNLSEEDRISISFNISEVLYD